MENPASTPAAPASSSGARSLVPLVVAAFFAALLVGGGYYALRGALNTGGGGTEESELPPGALPAGEYTKWEKPLVAIVVSGQMHGYINPCGCSHPQHGGLERRYNFIASLKAKGWDVVGIDLGELPEGGGIHAQNMLKYEYSVKALGAMNYRAIGLGLHEFNLGLGEAMAQIWDKNNPLPRPINMTLDIRGPGQVYDGLNVKPFEIVGDTAPKIGIVNMMGPDMTDPELANSLAKKEKFVKNSVELPKALKAFADGGVEIGVILHHEYPDLDVNKFPKGGLDRLLKVEEIRHAQAKKLAKFCAEERGKNAKVPAIQLMMLLMDEPEPPEEMKVLDAKLPTRVVEIGHKGKYVGLIGVYRDKDGYRLQYQKVLMSPEWATPEKDRAKQPIVAIMEKYQQEVKQQNMLARSPRTPHFNQIPNQNQKGLKATFVGSKKCSNCHDEATDVWKASYHAKAMDTLEKEKLPSNRQFDPECIKCHVTGFQNPGGYNDPVPVADIAKWPAKIALAPGQLEAHNKVLRGVGCESCHGPGSEHVANPNDANIRKMINPFKPTPVERQLENDLVKNPKDGKALAAWMNLSVARRRAMETTCLKCHDQENDVHWGEAGKDFVSRWLLNTDTKHRLIHHEKKNNNGAANPLPGKDAKVAAKDANVEPLPLIIEVDPPKKK